MKNRFYQRALTALTFLAMSVFINLSAQSSKSTREVLFYYASDGTACYGESCFPEFSWETTPMYYHFGDIDRVLEPNEVNTIAGKTDFICIEKSHGYNQLGDAVLGTKHEVKAFHEVKSESKVLFYYNSYVAWPFPRFNKDFTPEGIAKHKDLQEFLTIDPKTGKLKEKTRGPAFSYYFEALNPEFREWWVKSAAKGVKISRADGIFIDRMNVTPNSDYPDDKLAEIAVAKGQMMAELKKAIGPDKILIGNNGANTKEVFPSCDGFMFEHYNASVMTKESLLKDWEDMLRIAKAGKMSIYRFGAKGKGKRDITIGATNEDGGMEQLSKDQLEFYHACFLIGAQPYSYFQWNWGWNLADGNLVDYPELQKPLGAPEGAYVRVNPKGWEFTREYEHASVWVDTDKRKAKITWR